MTEEDAPDSKAAHPELTPEGADKKGQMLVIYLPEGSVIVDRTDINLATAPQAVVEKVETKPEPAPEVETAGPQPLQPTLQEVVQLAVQEVLKITGHDQSEAPKVEAPKVEAPKVEAPKIESSAPIVERQTAFADYPAPTARQTPSSAGGISHSNTDSTAHKGARHVHVRRRRKLNWVHGINTLLVAYLLLVAIVPAVMSSAFGTAIYASKTTHPGVLIAKGDLMVCTELPASQLKVNDVLLVRDGNSWHLDARQITSVTTAGALTTVNTGSTGGTAIDKTYVLPKDSGSYKVSRVIPKLGYVPIVLSSTLVKVLGGLFVLILNLTIHFRRLRRRRLETAVR